MGNAAKVTSPSFYWVEYRFKFDENFIKKSNEDSDIGNFI